MRLKRALKGDRIAAAAVLFAALSLCGCAWLGDLFDEATRGYDEPQEGRRAKLRVIYNGAGVRVFPNAECFDTKNNRAAGHAEVRIAFFKKPKSLGMALPPDGGYAEVYVRAGEPFAVSFGWSAKAGGTYYTCGPVGFALTPEVDEQYEASFVLGNRECGFKLFQLAPTKDGDFVRAALPEILSATTECKRCAPRCRGTVSPVQLMKP